MTRRPPLKPERVLGALRAYGHWYVPAARVAADVGASVPRVQVILRALLRERVVEVSAQPKIGSRRPVHTWRIAR